MTERVALTDEFYYSPLGEWVENHMYPSPDGGLVSFQRYVTGRKRAEEKLAESERRFVYWPNRSPITSGVFVPTGVSATGIKS